MVKVHTVHDNGGDVYLLEYNNIEGLIMSTEISRKRTKNVKRLLRLGKREVALVLRVDQEKGFIDLSRRKVKKEDALECEKRFKQAKIVHNILK